MLEMNLKDLEYSYSEQYNTIFLDRDGVINRHRPNDYVKKWEDFEFLPGVLEALAILSGYFKYIVVVTNQRGVGKGLMTEDELLRIHEKMILKIEHFGGRIDKIYYCTDTNDNSLNRKPNPGMALQAKIDFPDIDFEKSIMIGDSETDLGFGNGLGMKTISINNADNPESLLDFALSRCRKDERLAN